jgi:hypothetical protein
MFACLSVGVSAEIFNKFRHSCNYVETVIFRVTQDLWDTLNYVFVCYYNGYLLFCPLNEFMDYVCTKLIESNLVHNSFCIR